MCFACNCSKFFIRISIFLHEENKIKYSVAVTYWCCFLLLLARFFFGGRSLAPESVDLPYLSHHKGCALEMGIHDQQPICFCAGVLQNYYTHHQEFHSLIHDKSRANSFDRIKFVVDTVQISQSEIASFQIINLHSVSEFLHWVKCTRSRAQSKEHH